MESVWHCKFQHPFFHKKAASRYFNQAGKNGKISGGGGGGGAEVYQKTLDKLVSWLKRSFN